MKVHFKIIHLVYISIILIAMLYLLIFFLKNVLAYIFFLPAVLEIEPGAPHTLGKGPTGAASPLDF